MKIANPVIAFMFLFLLWVSVVTVEYDLVMHVGVLCSVFASLSSLAVLLDALLRAPEGYEGKNGFQIGVLARAVLR
jgi:hypothetical protein